MRRYLLAAKTAGNGVVKQLDSVEATKWIVWTNLSQWMYFTCGAKLLYQTVRMQTQGEKVTPRCLSRWKIFRRDMWPYLSRLITLLMSMLAYIYSIMESLIPTQKNNVWRSGQHTRPRNTSSVFETHRVFGKTTVVLCKMTQFLLCKIVLCKMTQLLLCKIVLCKISDFARLCDSFVYNHMM
jgi:hypothetical protein